MPDPYSDSHEDIRHLVGGVADLRDRQAETADRIIERDRVLHTGGANFIVRMERIMRDGASVTHTVESKVIGTKKKRRKRGSLR